MALHLLGYDSASSTTQWTQTNALVDVIARSNNAYVLNQDMNIYAAIAQGANLSGARINAPSLRQTVLPQITPLNVGATVPDPPKVMVWPFATPLRIRGGEEIRAESYISTSTTKVQVGLLIGDSIQPAPQGPVYTLVGTSTTACVASTWTQLTVVWNDSLPSGNYALCGLRVANTTGIFCRAFTPGFPWRPGGLCTVGVGAQSHPIFEMGRLGTWFVFNSFTLFSLEVLAESTDNAHTVFAEIVRIS